MPDRKTIGQPREKNPDSVIEENDFPQLKFATEDMISYYEDTALAVELEEDDQQPGVFKKVKTQPGRR